MTRRHLAALLAFLLVIPPTLSAQQEFAANSPEAATIAYMDAMTAGELDRMSGLMHPEALASFRGMLQPVVELADSGAEGTNEMLQMFEGVTSLAQLRKLSDAKFFSSFFAGITALQPDLLEVLKDAETEVLGHVEEGDDLAHVVYRMVLNIGTTMHKTEVVSLRRTKGGWGVLLSGEIEGMAESIRQSVEMGRQ